MRRAAYRGPPRSPGERTFFDAMRGLLRVRKNELDEREVRWKIDRKARKQGRPPDSDAKVSSHHP